MRVGKVSRSSAYFHPRIKTQQPAVQFPPTSPLQVQRSTSKTLTMKLAGVDVQPATPKGCSREKKGFNSKLEIHLLEA